jgi:integrase
VHLRATATLGSMAPNLLGRGYGNRVVQWRYHKNPRNLWRMGCPPICRPAKSDNVHKRQKKQRRSAICSSDEIFWKPVPSHILCGMKCGMKFRPDRRTHPSKALSSVKVRANLPPGRYADGNGLYLVVDASGARRWVLRTIVLGKRRDIGLGSARLVTLAEARQQAASLRHMARDGGDPLSARRRQRMVIPTFAEATRRVHEEHKNSWKNAKHEAQWLSTLETYVFPVLGDHRVDIIDTPDILRVLSPIWLKKPETARRVRQRVGTVLDWAKASGFRSSGNPVDGVAKGLPRQNARTGHFAAMPYSEVPGFVGSLRQCDASEVVRLALEFLILTASRTGEVRGATWAEVDLKAGIWTIPASRMKGKRAHRVPLSPRALEILMRARELSPGDHLFSGRGTHGPLSNNTFLMLLRRMGVEVTAHGFRSSFRDWAAERTNMPREVCELALAHAIKDRSEAAYRRGDLLEKRRELGDTWSAFVTSTGAKVVGLRVKRS